MIKVAVAFENVIFIKSRRLRDGIEDSMSGNRGTLNMVPGWDAKKEASSQLCLNYNTLRKMLFGWPGKCARVDLLLRYWGRGEGQAEEGREEGWLMHQLSTSVENTSSSF